MPLPLFLSSVDVAFSYVLEPIGHLPTSASHTRTSITEFYCVGLCVDSGDPNSSLHTFAASAVHIEPSPLQPQINLPKACTPPRHQFTPLLTNTLVKTRVTEAFELAEVFKSDKGV